MSGESDTREKTGAGAAFIRCPRCGTRTTAEAPHCPECGADPRTGLPSLKGGRLDKVRVCQGVSLRGVALLCDLAILAGAFLLAGLACYLVMVGQGRFAVVGEEPTSRPLWAVFGAAAFAYFWGFEAARGRTIGKRLLGLRVVRRDGSRVGAGAAFVRTALRLVDWLPLLYGVGALLVTITPRKQRLGDLAAGTVVVRVDRVTVDRLDEGDRAFVPWPGERRDAAS